MRLDQFVIGILLASVFIVGGTQLLGGTITTYGLNTTTDNVGLTAVYDKINESYDLGIDLKSETLDADTEGEDESWESLVKGAYSGVRLIRNSFTLAYDMIHAVAISVGIPQFLVDAAIIAVNVLIMFGIIYLIFRFKG